MDNDFYDILKKSPLSNSKSSIEEIAIWLNLNVLKTNDLIKIFKAIDNNYHKLNDVNSEFKLNWIFSSYDLIDYYCSNNILRNLFIVISKTDALDRFVYEQKLIAFVKQRRDWHRNRVDAMNQRFGHAAYESDLYEIFAELVDLLEDKLTKKSQSLLS